jgi:CheY-like chemotaxis protein
MISARVLVIEDDHIVARDIQRQLTRIGHTVVWSTSRGDDTLLLTLRTQPDLVLMDIRLEGDTDGVDAACRIRDECHVPVVFLTAYADDETERRASQAGSFGYILKPFEESQLRTIVKMALNKRRQSASSVRANAGSSQRPRALVTQ